MILPTDNLSGTQIANKFRARLIKTKGAFSLGKKKAANGEYQIIDLFCGCGGLSAGFEAFGQRCGGFKLVGAADLDEVATATYAENLPIKPLVADLSAVARSKTSGDLIDMFGINPDKPLIVIGGPPCQGFSAHRKKHGDTDDSRNGLVIAFATIAVRLQPEFIIFENVPEVLSKKNWALFKQLSRILKNNGYNVRAQVHNLASFGVPQDRFRALIIARKSWFKMPSFILRREEYRTVRDAIEHLAHVKPGEVGKDSMHFCAGHKQSTIDVIKAVPKNGGSRPVGVGPKCLQRVDGFRDVYGRMYWDRPANTITANSRNPAGGRYVHPEQNRGLTVREAALLQGFPKDYLFAGSFDEKFRQIGNAVPPIFAAMLAASIWENLMLNSNESNTEDCSLDLSEPLSNSFSSGIAGRKNYRPILR